MAIAENLNELKKSIPENVKLIAVTKTQPVEVIMQVYNCGHKILGENKVQELLKKQSELPSDIQWHLLGHLQTNKVKYIAPFINLIHSVDSLKLLKEINKEAIKNNRIIDCLFQVYIAKEETKYGLTYNELKEILENNEYNDLKNVRILGLMGMATFTDNKDVVRSEFIYLKKIFDEIKNTYFIDKDYFKELSMGMSGDYKIAIEEGSTMVRIGTAIFGQRNY
jgi:pyridoxal phosphate enzyme (YggS family)